MKKINAIAWLITMLMTMVASPAVANDFGSENVTMQVGETKTLYLPSSVTTKTLKSVTFYSESWKDVEVLSYTNYSVRVKALKATSIPVIVRCDYYYYINNGGYMYMNGGSYDYTISVKGEITVKPTKITIPSSVSIEVGISEDIIATVIPENAVYTLMWDISDNSIATVYQNGMITGKSVGSTNLTVKADNGVSAICRVTVTKPTPRIVDMKSSVVMTIGETYTLNPTVYPTNSEFTLTWSSDNQNVATVSQSGVVSAKNAGTANVTVKTDNGVMASCKVTVNPPKATEYEVNYDISNNGIVMYNDEMLIGKNSFIVQEGNDVSLTILPNEGYNIDGLWVNGENIADQLVDNVLTIRNIKANTSLTVSFKENDQPVIIVPVYLHCNVGDGGYITHGNTTIMGENKIGVGEGDDITVKIVADEGYHINAVKLDGEDVKSQLADNNLTIRNMTADKNLIVSFEADKQNPDVSAVSTENTMTLGNVTANTGTSVTFPIGMNNVDEITAFQIDLHLPAGIALAIDEDGDVKIETTGRISTRHTVDCSRMDDGIYRIICYSTKNATFTGNSGDLLNVALNIGTEMADGDYEITATNIILSDDTGTAHPGQTIKGKVTVKSYLIGDADNDGEHSINDAVCIINKILHRPNIVFVEAAADLDSDGDITINDAVVLIKKYILGQSSVLPQATRAAKKSANVNFMSIEDVTILPGEVKTIEVLMFNEHDDIRGIQCDITLPEGVSFLFNEETEDYVSASSRIPKRLIMSSEMQNKQTLRVAGVCTGNDSINGNSGAIFAFDMKADEAIQAGSYAIHLSNIKISDGKAISIDDCSSKLEVIDKITGITNTPSYFKENTIVYDLKGQRVETSKARNGIFIENGKKVHRK